MCSNNDVFTAIGYIWTSQGLAVLQSSVLHNIQPARLSDPELNN